MIYLTIIIFVLLLIHLYQRYGLDTSVYIATLYLVSLLAGVFVIKNHYDPFEYAEMPISLVPTVIFCLLIVTTIMIVANFNINSIQHVVIRNPLTIPILTILFAAATLTYLVFEGTELILRLSYGDFGELRDMVYEEDLSDVRYQGFSGIIVLIATVICTFSPIMLPILFISIIWEKRSKLFYILMMFSSTGSILEGFMNIDRSKVFYYILIMGLCLVMFWRKLEDNIRRKITPLLLAGLIGLLSYFTLVTNDRFGDRDTGNIGGVTWYAGQSYINFCYFWDYFEKQDGFSTRYLLPATHHFIIGDFDSGLARQKELSEQTGIFTAVFYTFIGSFMVDCNRVAPFLYVALFWLLIKICRHHRKDDEMSLFWFLFTWLLIVVPTAGVISYIYNNYSITLTIIIVMAIIAVCETFAPAKQIEE